MKQLSIAALLLASIFVGTGAFAQNAYQVFGPVTTRNSTNTAATPFGTSTLQLTCGASPTGIISSSSTGAAYVFTDNYITLAVNGGTPANICTGGYQDPNEVGTDCFNQAYTGAYQGLTGQNPDTFVGNYGVPALNISSDLVPNNAGKVQAQFQLIDTGVSLGSSSVWLVTNCTQNGISGGSATGTAITPTSQLDQIFPFDSTGGQRVEFEANYAAAAKTLIANSLNNPVPTINNQGIEPSSWAAVVANTSFATTKCVVETGELDSSGNPICAANTILCTNDNNPTPAGDNCMQSSAKNIQMLHTFDAAASSFAPPSLPFGTGIGFLMGSDSWPSSSCSFIGPEMGVMCPQNPITSFLGDFRSGSGGGSTNSTFVVVTGVPLPFTVPVFLPNRFGWSNNKTVNLTFVTYPPIVPPSNNNGFIAAPIASVTYGIEPGSPSLDTSLPIAGDVTLSNSAACPSMPMAGLAKPITETATATLPSDGTYQLHWFATDCAGTEELVFNPNAGSGSWTSFKAVPLNVDTTPPYVSNLTLSAAGPYKLNQVVKASYTCVDAPPGGSTATPSGVVLCGPTPLSLVLPTPNTGTLSSVVNTSSVGNHTFTVNVQDLAGNVGTPETVTYTVQK